jgi:hypothetical protein
LLALKTAGILWFLVGCCAVHKRAAVKKAEPAQGMRLTPIPARKMNYAN